MEDLVLADGRREQPDGKGDGVVRSCPLAEDLRAGWQELDDRGVGFTADRVQLDAVAGLDEE